MKITVFIAETGVGAVQFFQQNPTSIDLILMDCRMPEMDGYEATEIIRDFELRANRNKRIPIIALTANAIQGDAEKCRLCGMDDYLPKPINRNQLEISLAHWLSIDHVSPIDINNNQEIREHTEALLIDREIYNEMKEVMGEDMVMIVNQYIISLPDYISKMKASLAEQKFIEVADFAHPLKSSSASIGTMKITKTCKEIEQLARSESPDHKILADLINTVEITSEMTIKELEKLNETA